MSRRTLAVAGMVMLTLVALVSLNLSQNKPVELFTDPHAEVAPFQRVWNPDTDNAHTVKDLSSERSESKIIFDDLCGIDGSKCPELPAFNGEDYFSSTPIGCCYTPEQQELWTKWKSLADRVVKLEGTVHHLRQLQDDTQIQYKLGARGKNSRLQHRHTPSMLRGDNKDAAKDGAAAETKRWGVPVPL
eukprot:CAMPEP_0196758586 /NCGR_PEP_ID=MMETSP1091-20130531/104265_1 /TAXON_ID=302021 /ORGANISM="Rhodomonas sp., Strain CCMP768" /LENGTH=187 /DNA_ID=CAMNT_0042107415 /DNA_START=13 /DNA_END=576 /DNA_ORIENTATION=+